MKKIIYALTTSGLIMMSGDSWAQATPTELANLSMQELLGMNVFEGKSIDAPWSVNVSTRFLMLEGFRRGTTNVSEDSLLAFPANTSNQTFPILPNSIEQQVTTVNVSYQFTENLIGSISLPWIIQKSDHISVVPDSNFEEFLITTEGIGDISLGMQYLFSTSNAQGTWAFNAGLSFPTGSIDETGDTPRENPENDLPYTMQLGSGTFDIPLSLSYSSNFDTVRWGANAGVRIRTGRNDKEYRLGDRVTLGAWSRLETNSWLHPGVKVNAQYTEDVQGEDTEILGLNGEFPAPITNPENYGGNKVSLGLSLRVADPNQGIKGYLDFDVSKPIYQDLNGVQVQEDIQYGLSFGVNF